MILWRSKNKNISFAMEGNKGIVSFFGRDSGRAVFGSAGYSVTQSVKNVQFLNVWIQCKRFGFLPLFQLYTIRIFYTI